MVTTNPGADPRLLSRSFVVDSSGIVSPSPSPTSVDQYQFFPPQTGASGNMFTTAWFTDNYSGYPYYRHTTAALPPSFTPTVLSISSGGLPVVGASAQSSSTAYLFQTD
jgi:hypothetical protein